MDTYAGDLRLWSLKAPEARVLEPLRRIDMDRPRLVFFRDGRRSSDLAAERGRLETDTRDMWAGGGVVITSTEGARLVSDWVRYENAGDRLVSTAPVTITRGRSVVRGTGWTARSDFSEMEIRSQRGEIAPEDERVLSPP